MVVEEVVVTARKREESLQEVPVAVSAFSGEQLTNAGVDQFSDIADYTPSLFISQQSTYGNATADGLVLRGQSGGGTQISNDPAVGLYID
ncbi:MAG: Plug domain-containing protein, partial [Gammaproteobacteria bacterium]|nr:Plug domain-containing protein [Gammaproteobacteria bacterium]